MAQHPYPSGSDKQSLQHVPPVIAHSWQRSRELKLSEEKVERNDLLPSHQLRQRCQANENLLRAMQACLAQIVNLLPDNDYLLLLSDPEGYILEAFGDPVFLNKAQKVYLSPGANWREDVKGTNAIGTVLVENSPVEVLGWEHFVRENHFLACWAAPIRNLKGEIVGVLDISGEAKEKENRNLQVAIFAAKMIEQQLHCYELQSSVKLYDGAMQLLKELLMQNSVSINAVGQVDQITPTGAKKLGWKPKEVTDQTLPDVLTHLRALNNAADKYPLLQTKGPVRPHPRSPVKTRWVGRSELTKKVFAQAAKAAAANCSVLIIGESGTGKDVVARYIHQLSSRTDAPFVALNCGAIPRSLIQSELFGYANGAFTGAKLGGSPGKFEVANTGTIFLDEIGETTPEVQVALLRVLQEKEINRLGEAQPRKIDTRVIAATNQNLEALVAKKQFRLDLLYRLRVVTIHIPPLRHRREDLFDLIPHFVQEACTASGKPKLTVAEEVYKVLINYKWPGNIRELENCITSMVAMAEGPVLTCNDLPEELASDLPMQRVANDSLLNRQTKQVILQALLETKGKVAPAARLLGMGRATLYRKLKQYDIEL